MSKFGDGIESDFGSDFGSDFDSDFGYHENGDKELEKAIKASKDEHNDKIKKFMQEAGLPAPDVVINSNPKNNDEDQDLQRAINESLNNNGNRNQIDAVVNEDEELQKAINASLSNNDEPDYDPELDPNVIYANNEVNPLVLDDTEDAYKYNEKNKQINPDTVINSIFNPIKKLLTDITESVNSTTSVSKQPTSPENNSNRTEVITTSSSKKLFPGEFNEQKIAKPEKLENKFQIKIYNHFSKEFVAKSINSSDKSTKEKLFYQNSDKIILPRDSLETLSIEDSNLYVLRITNPHTVAYTFVCASDFSAPERTMFVPDWVLEATGTNSGTRLYVDAIGIPVVTEVTIKVPSGFSKLQNPMSIIEYCLRNHSIIFLHKKFNINMFEQQYEFEVIEMKPANIGNITMADVKLSIEEA